MKRLIFLLIVSIFLISNTGLAENEWLLTQYSDLSGNQAMCYSLVSGDDLILIDGGWAENAPQVREIIEANGGHVRAWFLTHYHGDHAGAFNALWDEYKNRIDVVYCTPLDWNEFIEQAREWDTPEVFEAFLKNTEGETRIIRLNRGDSLEIAGLKISIFNAYDDIVKKYSDYANNCSLVFKVSNEKQSVLFLGDVWRKDLGMEILELYGAEALQADYIQAGHHGNNTQSFEFYKALNPSVIFLDGPEWLMTGEDYDAKDLLAWCAENGITTYDYRQAPVTLPLD